MSFEAKEYFNFIDDYDCDLAIKFIEKKRFAKQMMFAKQDKRDVLRNPSDDEIVYLIKKYVKKISSEYPEYSELYPHVAFLLRYGKNAFLYEHSDIMDDECSECKLSLVLYFNSNFVGGEIYFPNANLEYSPEAGSALVYDPNPEEAYHGVRKVEEGIKYVLPICLTVNKEKCAKEYR